LIGFISVPLRRGRRWLRFKFRCFCSVAALAALARIQAPATINDKQVRDLRNLPGVSMTPVAVPGWAV